MVAAGYKGNYSESDEYARHINACYSDLSATEEFTSNYTDHAVYDADLWVAVADVETKQVVASGIAGYDPEAREGALEWIQVTESCRGKGLGSL